MKWIVRIIGVLVLVAVVAVIGILMLPADRIAQIATDQLRKATGRDVSISGDVSMTFWPVLGVSADGLEVGNAEWAKEGPLFSASSAAIGVNARALLSGDIVITNIEAQSPTIRLEQKLDGRASWQFTDATGEAQIATETSPDREAQSLTIQSLKVTDATLIYDAEGSDLVSYSGVDLALDWPEAAGAAVIEASLIPAGEKVTVQATVQDFAAFLTGAQQGVVASLTSAGGSASLDGQASLAGAVQGKMALKTGDTSGFLTQLGLPAVDLPAGLGRSINLSSALNLTAERNLALRDVVADLGGNTLRGRADISLNGTPDVQAELSAGALDLRSLTAVVRLLLLLMMAVQRPQVGPGHQLMPRALRLLTATSACKPAASIWGP